MMKDINRIKVVLVEKNLYTTWKLLLGLCPIVQPAIY